MVLRKTKIFQPLNRAVPKRRKSTGTERKRENGEKWAADGRSKVHRSLGQCIGIVWVFWRPDRVTRRVKRVGWRSERNPQRTFSIFYQVFQLLSWPWLSASSIACQSALNFDPLEAFRSSLLRSLRAHRRGSGECQGIRRYNRHCATTSSTLSVYSDSILRVEAQPGRTAVVRDPYARWCGRGGAVRRPPIPINPISNQPHFIPL